MFMSRKISLALVSLLALNANSASAIGENNSKLQYLLQRARTRSTTYHQQTAPAQAEPFIPQQQVQEIPAQEPPPLPMLVPEAIEQHEPAAVTEPEPVAAEPEPAKTHHVEAHHQDRAPVILETHPRKEEPKVEKIQQEESEQVHPAPAPITHKREVQVHTQNTISQPPVQTIVSPAASPIHTEVQSNSSIEVHHEIETQSTHLTTHPEATKEEPAPTEHKASNDVALFLNQILGSTTEAPSIELKEEEAEVIETVHEEVPVKEEVKVVQEQPRPTPAAIPAAPALEDAPVETLKAQPEQELTKENSQALNLTDKESDYLLIVRKSLKSLEDDPWVKVKNNMDEALAYFEKEKNLGTTEDVDVYQKITLACKRFSEGGLELDEGDFADFEKAEGLYLDTKDLLQEAKKKIKGKTDYKNSQLNEIINALLGYTEEELQYIEEMLGM